MLGPLNDKIKLPIIHVHEIASRLQDTANRIQVLHEASAQDDDFCYPKPIFQAGWPGQIQEVPWR